MKMKKQNEDEKMSFFLLNKKNSYPLYKTSNLDDLKYVTIFLICLLEQKMQPFKVQSRLKMPILHCFALHRGQQIFELLKKNQKTQKEMIAEVASGWNSTNSRGGERGTGGATAPQKQSPQVATLSKKDKDKGSRVGGIRLRGEKKKGKG